MDPAPHQIFRCNTKSKFQLYGYRVKNWPCHMEVYPQSDSPNINSSFGTQNKIFNCMGIGLGTDYLTWRNIQKWIRLASNLHVGDKKNL